jgi:microcystin-dependent protein
VARDTFFGHNMVGQAEWERRGAATSAAASAISAALPVGVINAYYGTTAPSGWLLCDGAAIPAQYTALIALVGANTPNLKGRVLVGLNAAEAEFDTLGETGGAKTVTLTTTEMPSHDHGTDTSDVNLTHDHTGATGNTGAHQHDSPNQYVITHTGDPYRVGDSVGATSQQVTFTDFTDSAGAHAHGIVESLGSHDHNIDAQGSGGAHANLQPYAVISYIIKAVA